MKFSIIIPVHNAEKYLKDCIDSIYDQDMTDFEIICVVNGSNDESENICLLAREDHSNIRVIVTDAVGVSSSAYPLSRLNVSAIAFAPGGSMSRYFQ